MNDDSVSLLLTPPSGTKLVSRINQSFIPSTTRRRRRRGQSCNLQSVAERAFVDAIRSVVSAYVSVTKNGTPDSLNILDERLSELCVVIREHLGMLTMKNAIQLYDEIHKQNVEVQEVIQSFLKLVLEMCLVHRFASNSLFILVFLIGNEPYLCHYLMTTTDQFYNMLYFCYNQLVDLTHANTKVSHSNETLLFMNRILAFIQVWSHYYTREFYSHVLNSDMSHAIINSLLDLITSNDNNCLQHRALSILAHIVSFNNTTENRYHFQTFYIDQFPENTRTNLYKALIQFLTAQNINIVIYALTCLSALTLRNKDNQSYIAEVQEASKQNTSAISMATQLGEKVFSKQNIQQTFQLNFRLLSAMTDPFEPQPCIEVITPIRYEQAFYAINMLRCFLGNPSTGTLLSKYQNLDANILRILQLLSESDCPNLLSKNIVVINAFLENTDTVDYVVSCLRYKDNDETLISRLVSNLILMISTCAEQCSVCKRKSIDYLQCAISSAQFLILLYKNLGDQLIGSELDPPMQDSISTIFDSIDHCLERLRTQSSSEVTYHSRTMSSMHCGLCAMLVTLLQSIVLFSSRSTKRKIQSKYTDKLKKMFYFSISTKNMPIAISTCSLIIKSDIMAEDELLHTLTAPKFSEILSGALIVHKGNQMKTIICTDIINRTNLSNALYCVQYLGEFNMQELESCAFHLQQYQSNNISALRTVEKKEEANHLSNTGEKIALEKRIRELEMQNKALSLALEQANMTQQQTFEQLEKTNQNLRSELEQTKLKHTTTISELGKCRVDLTGKSEKLEDTYKKLIMLTTIHKKMMENRESSSRTIRSIENELNKEKTSRIEFEAKLQKLQQYCQELTTSKEYHLHQIAELTSKLQNYKSEMDQLNLNHNQIYVDLNSQIESMKNQNQTLNSQISMKDKELHDYLQIHSLIHKLTGGKKPNAELLSQINDKF